MKEKQTLEEIYAIAGKSLTDKLLEIVKKEHLVPWFYKSNKAFNNKKPIDLCREGKTGQLERMYYDIASGSPF